MAVPGINDLPPTIETLRTHRRLLLVFSHDLLTLRSIHDIAAKACDTAREITLASHARILVLDADNQFVNTASSGWPQEDRSAGDTRVDNVLDTEPGYTARVREPVVVADMATESRFAIPDTYTTLGIKTGVNMPMCDSDQVVGVTSVHDTALRSWNMEDIEALQFLANLTASAVLFRRERERAELATENQLKAVQELRLKSAALDGTADMVVITDIHGQVEYVNPAFTRETGFTPSDVIGKRFSFLKSEATAPDLYHEIWEALFSGRSWKGTVVNNHRDGTDYLEEQTITPVRGDDGQVQHFVAIKRVLPQ